MLCCSSRSPAPMLLRPIVYDRKILKFSTQKFSMSRWDWQSLVTMRLKRPKVSSMLSISLPVVHCIIIGKKKNEHKKISASIQFWQRFSVLIVICHYPGVIHIWFSVMVRTNKLQRGIWKQINKIPNPLSLYEHDVRVWSVELGDWSTTIFVYLY